MKIKLLALILAAMPLLLTAQNTVVWSDSVAVAQPSNFVTAPRVALLSDGTPIVVWGESGSPARIFCARFENGSFTAPVSVVKSPAVPALFGFGGFEVAVRGEVVFVVFEQSGQGIKISKSVDGGKNFAAAVAVQPPFSGGYATLASVAIDATGNPIVSFIRDKSGGATYEIRRSADGGSSFGSPVVANLPAPGGKVCECCTSDLEVSGDSIWLIFRNNNQNLRDIWVSRSTDGGANFTAATDIDSTDWLIPACPISGPRMARSGDSLATIWVSAASGASRVFFSNLHAATMQPGQQFGFPTGGSGGQSQPDIVAAGDTLGIVFRGAAGGLVFHFSTSGASGLLADWQQFSGAAGGFQYPSLAFSDGVFHLTAVETATKRVLYRRGVLTQKSASSEPTARLVSIFPNPTAAGFWVKTELAESAEISIFDPAGAVHFFEKNWSLASPVPTAGLPAGVYFLKIKTRAGSFFQKLLLQN